MYLCIAKIMILQQQGHNNLERRKYLLRGFCEYERKLIIINTRTREPRCRQKETKGI